MSLLYKATDKELLKLRQDIFIRFGIPSLEKQGFKKTPFSGSHFGWNGFGYMYEYCRILEKSRLEMVTVNINRGEKWVQIYLNIFQLFPDISAIEQLDGIDGVQFHLPPNTDTLMRLEPPKGIIFHKMPQHKIKIYFTKVGLENRLSQLGNLIEDDLNNIDDFIKRWLKIYSPLLTIWDGNPLT